MRKLALLAAALAVPGIASAATPQGQLTGTGEVNVPSFAIAISTTIKDGGTSYIGAGNDLSGNCNGDSGAVTVFSGTFPIVCAHYVASSVCCHRGSPKMRFAYHSLRSYWVVRITDNGDSPDTLGVATTPQLS